MKFIITGGANHKGKGLFQKKVKGGYGHIFQLDWNKKSIERRLKYITPDNMVNPNITKELTFGHIYGNELYVTSRTEIIIIDLVKLTIKRKISDPTFHDLHHVRRIDNQLFVANTGLEMVQRFSLDGKELEQINLSNIPTWDRFDKNLDYRLVESTKPHKLHVNYLFEKDHGEIWATCLNTKEVICIYGRKERIKIIEGYIHDGLVTRNSIYFTTTNGFLISVDRKSLKTKKKYDISSEYKIKKGGYLGWCRGVYIADRRAYVGFTSIRPTKNKEFIRNLKNKNNSLTSRIVEIDLQNGRIMDEYILPFNNSIIFSIIQLR